MATPDRQQAREERELAKLRELADRHQPSAAAAPPSKWESSSSDLIAARYQTPARPRPTAPARAVPPPPTGTATVNTYAVVSFACAFLITPLAIVFGHVALGEIRRTGERGQGFAVAGLVIGYLSVGVGLIVAIATLSSLGSLS